MRTIKSRGLSPKEASVKTHELRPFSPMFNRRVRPLILQPTAIEALSPPGSSLQASHQDALIHLSASTAPQFEHKRLYRNLCTKGIGVDPWAGRTAWVTALRRSPSCSVLRTAKCTGVAIAQPGRISCSHRLRHRTSALVAAVLPGSWASLPIAGRAITRLRILPDVKQTGGPSPGRLRQPRRGV